VSGCVIPIERPGAVLEEDADMASRWKFPLAGCALAMVSLVYPTSAQRQDATRADVPAETGATFVTFEREEVPPDFLEAVARAGGRVVFNLSDLGVTVVAGLPAASVQHLAGGGADVAPDVWIPLGPGASVEPGPASMLSEPLLEAQWGLRLTEAQRAIEAGFTGSGARIAIIDSGVYYDHPDLAPNYAGGVNFFAPFCGADPAAPPSACDPADPDDTNGHGTWVAGIVAAALNGQGIVGVAPEAHIIAIKACGFALPGACPLSAVVAGIAHAADSGADVINLSINCVVGVTCPEEEGLVKALRRATNYASRKGTLVVTISQNNGLDLDASRLRLAIGEFDHVIVVSAVGPDAESATLFGVPYSNIGRVVDLAAPGGSVPIAGVIGTWSPLVPIPLGGVGVLPGGLYAISGGTSAAAPHVAGAAAQLIGQRGPTNPALVKILLQRTAVDLGVPGRDPVFGYGLVNVWALLTQ
jgi:lantibiotic leader peptide-processing serine protease